MIVAFKNLPGWVVSFAAMDSYFLFLRRVHGNLLESERSGGGDTGFGTDCLSLCGEWGDTLSQIAQGGTVQAFRD
jgi:hypothetical protein